MEQVGWVADYVDDLWADCLHYYGVDIWDMEGARVMKLAYRLPDIMAVEQGVEHPYRRSSVSRALSDALAPEPEPTAPVQQPLIPGQLSERELAAAEQWLTPTAQLSSTFAGLDGSFEEVE